MLRARKSAPKVRNGRVQKKNRWDLSPSYYSHAELWPVIDRKRPGRGRHLLRKADVERFLQLLPDWPELSRGLNAIVLAPFERSMGYHTPGVVHLCAWERDLWWNDTVPAFVEDHSATLNQLGVKTRNDDGRLVVMWTADQARAFQLLHVLVHELGHHHDRMTTRSQRASRGELFAESYAVTSGKVIWQRYCSEFGDPALT
jgi:hypothetical protein